MSILLGAEIEKALHRTAKPIALLDIAGALVVRLSSASDVLPYIARGYEVHGTKRRVRYVCPPRPVVQRTMDRPWMKCYRTAESAVLPPSIDWVQEMYPSERIRKPSVLSMACAGAL